MTSNVTENDVLGLDNDALFKSTDKGEEFELSEEFENEYKLIDRLAKNAATHITKLVNQQKLLEKNNILKSEINKVSQKDFESAIPDKLDRIKKKIKLVNENQSLLETKEKTKPIDKETIKWGGIGSGGVTDQMKLEAKLINLQRFTDPTRGFNKESVSSKLPKHFEIGTFQDSNVDYYNRFTNKQKKQGTLGDILQNEQLLDYIETKSNKIMEETEKFGKRHVSKKRKSRK
ncbi:hypothetical protein DLAC_02600 [Tieghemostelium lacteum]|uniref:Fcf2 pre-rRNA processing C-terminal domain-containing protein n=1 Tax=Tieghemostelium lacteum TaxID=361077 RepID=A0A152A3F5_TIELA|nr:hypothetical protein DLAC_02600 [Tieghemostelium lacteum]|eukprot:KYR00581.1 hypothetical protein DLAC_02600 [Tieghemostelium lacteum]